MPMSLLNLRSLTLVASIALTMTWIDATKAQPYTNAQGFIQDLGSKMVAIVSRDIPMSEKRTTIQPLIEQNVDVDGIGRYCLGRFWTTATPAQQKEYMRLFHTILLNSILSKIGDFQNVSFTVGPTVTKNQEEITVNTIISRPGQAPANVQWVVTNNGAEFKVVDMIGEGASLRLSQRQDYSSFISRNAGNIDLLLAAMVHQIQRNQ